MEVIAKQAHIFLWKHIIYYSSAGISIYFHDINWVQNATVATRFIAYDGLALQSTVQYLCIQCRESTKMSIKWIAYRVADWVQDENHQTLYRRRQHLWVPPFSLSQPLGLVCSINFHFTRLPAHAGLVRRGIKANKPHVSLVLVSEPLWWQSWLFTL